MTTVPYAVWVFFPFEQPHDNPQVEVPKTAYAGHHLIKAVRRGTAPTAPHQLWKYTPRPIITTPAIILIVLSILPTLDFITLPPFITYTISN